MKNDHPDRLTILLSEEELGLLRKYEFPEAAQVLATARPKGGRVELTGQRDSFRGLAESVAAMANAAMRECATRRARLLDRVHIELEVALGSFLASS